MLPSFARSLRSYFNTPHAEYDFVWWDVFLIWWKLPASFSSGSVPLQSSDFQRMRPVFFFLFHSFQTVRLTEKIMPQALAHESAASEGAVQLPYFYFKSGKERCQPMLTTTSKYRITFIKFPTTTASADTSTATETKSTTTGTGQKKQRSYYSQEYICAKHHSYSRYEVSGGSGHISKRKYGWNRQKWRIRSLISTWEVELFDICIRTAQT